MGGNILAAAGVANPDRLADLERLTLRMFDPDGLLAARGAAIGQHFQTRPEQLAYAVRVARLLARGYRPAEDLSAAIGAIEAATGVGKTLGYLVPLALYAKLSGQRALVSTATIALQHQIVQAEWPAVAAAVRALLGGPELRIAIRKGARNFVSPSRAARLLAAVDRTEMAKGGRAVWDAFARWIANAETDPLWTGDLTEFEANHGALPPSLQRDEVRLLPGAAAAEVGPFERHLAAADQADIVVTNHALLMRNAERWGTVLERLSPPAAGDAAATALDWRIRAVVVDEAYGLESAGESVGQSVVAGSTLVHAAHLAVRHGYAGRGFATAAGEAFAWLQEIAAGVERGEIGRDLLIERAGWRGLLLTSTDRAWLRARTLKTVDALAGHAEGALNRMIADGPVAGLGNAEYRETVCLFGDLVADLRRIRFSGQTSVRGEPWATPVIAWSPNRLYPSIMCVPRQPAAITARLFRRGFFDPPAVVDRDCWPEALRSGNLRDPLHHVVLFTSATLDAPSPGATGTRSRFRGFFDTIGCWPGMAVVEDALASFEPEAFGRMSFVLMDPAAPHPTLETPSEGDRAFATSPGWLDAAAAITARAAGAGGRTLVLANSFADVDGFEERLRDELGDRLLPHRRGASMASLVEAYRRDEDAVLVTPSGWEGLSLVDGRRRTIVDQLVVGRLPFAPPDPVRDRLIELDVLARGGTADGAAAAIHLRRQRRALRTLRQGIGRGIRDAEHSVTVWIADPRFPLPATLTTDPFSGRSSRYALRYAAFAACLPYRFRISALSGYQAATIFELPADGRDPATPIPDCAPGRPARVKRSRRTDASQTHAPASKYP